MLAKRLSGKVIGVGVVTLLLLPRVGWAQVVDDATRRAARNLGATGVEAYEAQDYKTAHEKLDKAYRTLRAPTLGLWSARALSKLNKLVEAAERYQEVVRLEIAGGDRAVQLQAQADAAAELQRLAPQIPNVIVQLSGVASDAVHVTVDGVPLAASLLGEPRPVNPGTHHARATAGTRTAEAEVTISLGETKSVVLRFTANARAAPEPGPTPATPTPASAATPGATLNPGSSKSRSYRRPLGFTALGVGGAALAVGGTALALALAKKERIDSSPHCQDNRCLRAETDLVNSYSTWRTVSSVGVIGGVVLGAAGVALLLGARASNGQTAILLTPDSVALSRRF